MRAAQRGRRRSGLRRLNASTYGAVGNGVADDTTALENALAAAGAVAPSQLVVAAGTFMLSSYLHYPSNVRVTGAGIDLTTFKNLTTRSGSNTYMMLPVGEGGSDTNGSIIEGITFDQRGDFFGDASDQILFSVDGTRNVTIQSCGFRNVRTIAVWSDSLPARPASGVRLVGNHVFQSRGDGFSFFGELPGFTIANNLIEHTQDDAIAVQDTGPGTSNGVPSFGTITDNTILNCNTQNSFGATARGILVFGGHHVDVLRNTVTNTYASNLMACEGVARRAHDIVFGENTGVGAGSGNTSSGVGTTTPAYGVFLANADTVLVRNTAISGGLHGDAEYFYTGCTAVTESGNT